MWHKTNVGTADFIESRIEEEKEGTKPMLPVLATNIGLKRVSATLACVI